MLNRLGDRPRNEGLHHCHHPDVALDRERALAVAAAWAGTVEDRQMLGLQIWRALQRHGAAAEAVGGVNLGPGEAERRLQLEGGIIERAQRDP
jgi:hypothetical protein